MEEMKWTKNNGKIQENFTEEKKIVLAREDDLVYSCLDLNPKGRVTVTGRDRFVIRQSVKESVLPDSKRSGPRSLAELLYPHRKEVGVKTWQ